MTDTTHTKNEEFSTMTDLQASVEQWAQATLKPDMVKSRLVIPACYAGITPRTRTPEEVEAQAEYERSLTWTGEKFTPELTRNEVCKRVREDIKAAVSAALLPDVEYRVSTRKGGYYNEFELVIRTWFDDEVSGLESITRPYNWSKATGETMQGDGAKFRKFFRFVHEYLD